MAISEYVRKNIKQLWYPAADLGVNPGVTTVGAASVAEDLDFAGFEQIAGRCQLTVPAGSVFHLRLTGLDIAGNPMGTYGPFVDLGTLASGVNNVAFVHGAKLPNYGYFANTNAVDAVIASGAFVSNRYPIGGFKKFRLGVLRVSGAGEAVVDALEIYLR